jgi:hypothetical protein
MKVFPLFLSMFNTKNLIVNESEVPSYWVFQHYLQLSVKLTGQDVKIKSVFNLNDKIPSMSIYVDKSIMQYKFKDFSTGYGGNKIDLMKHMFGLQYPHAVEKLITDYNNYTRNETIEALILKAESKWVVDLIEIRPWTTEDKLFWLSFRIGSEMLSEYNVKPLAWYDMIKQDDEQINKLKIEGPMIYGYFTTDGDLYKIYQPTRKNHKFLKIKSHLQGIDQLKYNQPYLLICSSLKDGMSIKGFGYNLEIIAPDSENTIIKPYIIESFKEKYKNIATLFDNDAAGIKAAQRYEEIYGIKSVLLTLSKDFSDSIKEFGFEIVHATIKPLLKQILNS